MLKRIWRSRRLQRWLGLSIAYYLIFVRKTTTFEVDNAEMYARIDAEWPVIIAIWHGQHLMLSYAKRDKDRYNVLISGHGDGEINAIAVERLGIGLIRGSGAQHAYQVRKRGGARAIRQMLRTLERGESVTMTGDVPKIARVASPGLVTLAQMSGRPIVPVAVVTKNRIDFKSWDRASIGLPLFNSGVIALGEMIHVARDADAPAQEAKRLELEAALDAVHARAYALLGSSDPGAGRDSVLAARRARQDEIQTEIRRRADADAARISDRPSGAQT